MIVLGIWPVLSQCYWQCSAKFAKCTRQKQNGKLRLSYLQVHHTVCRSVGESGNRSNRNQIEIAEKFSIGLRPDWSTGLWFLTRLPIFSFSLFLQNSSSNLRWSVLKALGSSCFRVHSFVFFFASSFRELLLLKKPSARRFLVESSTNLFFGCIKRFYMQPERCEPNRIELVSWLKMHIVRMLSRFQRSTGRAFRLMSLNTSHTGKLLELLSARVIEVSIASNVHSRGTKKKVSGKAYSNAASMMLLTRFMTRKNSFPAFHQCHRRLKRVQWLRMRRTKAFRHR